MSKDSNKKIVLNDGSSQNQHEGRKSQLSGKSGGGLSCGGLIASGNPTLSGNGNRNASTNMGHNSNYPATDKLKRNGRKLNSGIPAKILIGRQG